MALATFKSEARVGPDTDYRSIIIDPLPAYPEHAGKMAGDLQSGSLVLSFAWGYDTPAHLHASIARLRDALDQLDIDIDAAMAAQAARVESVVELPDAGDHFVRMAS